MEEIKRIFEQQSSHHWKISQTSSTERIKKLRKLKETIFAHKKDLQKAIHDDFGKNPSETDLTEVYPTISEINHSIKHLRQWMKPQTVKTPITLFGTHSEVRHEAKGVVLILSPWNYPFQLLMSPLVAAISAGNCVMLKPSSKTAQTSHFLKKLISEIFDENEVALIEGDNVVADALLELPFDHIFFTGSTRIGKKVMEAAAKNLTPVTLELGGKSPVIVDKSANIKKAAERIVWGKFINAGQTCVAPDYLLLHENHLDEFVTEAKKIITARYGQTEKEQESSSDLCRLVSDGALQTMKKILEESVQKGAKIEMGGKTNSNSRFLSPTLLSHVTDDSPIMQEEIFGPILPILTYRTLDDALRIIHKRGKPLALYIFGNDQEKIEEILKNTSAGGTCINTLIVHLANPDLPFGGVGYSGMGNYHGHYGFRTFSHERAVLRQGKIDTLKMFYPPYTSKVKKMIEWAIKYLS